ncbi:MAG: sulfite exporter TauE/SafE family protein [Deltaproteobacteria bacterium]|nr:sulfite exporter TauE/SafE family protein [Deltaproteobacteria bacterium]
MNFFLIGIVSFASSCLTLFSGFGLGTILLPAFALFLPVPMAVTATAVVHAANNLLKAVLLGRLANFRIVLIFGLPAIAAAYFGATILANLTNLPTILAYRVMGITAQITPLKLVMGLLILGFSLFELNPKLQRLSLERKYLPFGGILSGFFGGLSGHQGAFRSVFLSKIDITPQAFVGTNAVIALLVDSTRLLIYGTMLSEFNLSRLASMPEGKMILTGIAAAFLGVFVGRQFLHKVTMKTIQQVTGSLLILIGFILTMGLI